MQRKQRLRRGIRLKGIEPREINALQIAALALIALLKTVQCSGLLTCAAEKQRKSGKDDRKPAIEMSFRMSHVISAFCRINPQSCAAFNQPLNPRAHIRYFLRADTVCHRIAMEVHRVSQRL